MTIPRRVLTAYHEAGHAAALAVFGVPFRYVTIRPRSPEAAGLVMHRVPHLCPPDDSARFQIDPESAEQTVAFLRITGQLLPAENSHESAYDSWFMSMLAGEVAATLATWPADGRASEESALRDFWGESIHTGSDAHALSELESSDYLEWVEGETRALAQQHWQSIEAVAAALLDNGTLTQAQVCALVS